MPVMLLHGSPTGPVIGVFDDVMSDSTLASVKPVQASFFFYLNTEFTTSLIVLKNIN